MMSPDEIYFSYVNWCLKIGVPPLSRPAYEKALTSISSNPTNIDAILRNNSRNKDK